MTNFHVEFPKFMHNLKHVNSVKHQIAIPSRTVTGQWIFYSFTAGELSVRSAVLSFLAYTLLCVGSSVRGCKISLSAMHSSIR